jgi:glycosyltransferase involved in cell wall biosynthesis
MARIAFVIPDLGGGGAERVALTLVAGLVERGHSVDLVVMQGDGPLRPLVPAGVRVIELGARRLRDALRPLLSYLRRERPVAIQVSMWPLTAIALVAARIALPPRARVVVSDHAPLSRHYAGQSRTLGLLKLSMRLLYPLASARIAVSEGVADDLAHISGLERRDFEVIYSPVPAPTPDAAADHVAEKQWGGAVHRILAVGNFKVEKNYRLLLDAVALLYPELDWRLVILGDGPLRGALESQIAALGVEGRVALAGFVSEPAPFFRAANLFVLSSDFEGYGVVLIEALHAGLPIVSTDCESGPREILHDGEFGTLVPCGDSRALVSAIHQALEQPVDAERQRARGRVFADNKALDRYLELLLGQGRA